MKVKIIITTCALLTNVMCFAQEKMGTTSFSYDTEKLKIIPDKFFEIGIPLLIIFFLINTLVSVLKNRAEHQLKLKMIEKGVSEDTLIRIFKESNAISRLQPLKWFLYTLCSALALLVIYLFRDLFNNQSGYLAVAIFLVFNSAAFLIYYYILSKKV
jgi:hypothetical protein